VNVGCNDLSGRLIGWSKLKPSQEIEWLALSHVAAVLKPSGDGRQILKSNMDLLGLLLKDLSPFILGQALPGGVLADGDERRADCFGAT